MRPVEAAVVVFSLYSTVGMCVSTALLLQYAGFWMAVTNALVIIVYAKPLCTAERSRRNHSNYPHMLTKRSGNMFHVQGGTYV